MRPDPVSGRAPGPGAWTGFAGNMMREQYDDPMPLNWLKGWHIAVTAEYLMVAVLLLVPFGFDHPSSWGLDFTHLIIAIVFLIIASAGALVTCLFERTIVGLSLTIAPWACFFLSLWRM